MVPLQGHAAKAESVEHDSTEVKLERRDSAEDDYGMGTIQVGVKDEPASSRSTSPSESSTKLQRNNASDSPASVKADVSIDSPVDNDEHEEKVGAEVTVKMEPGQPPKLARISSQKVIARAAPLFDHLPDKTEEATMGFQVMDKCVYANKYLGYTEHAMECDCSEEWDPSTKQNSACGDDSDCINRATKMECVGDCGCGSECRNQRFQRRQYANVSVIQTEKKGYGLRTDTDLRPNDFIFEYIGEVINEASFRRRMIQYDEEGIKHFYFMSLSKGEFVDATKRGNLGRFCNHSCNPNCYVDKWVVGDKLRMGIFAERKIKAGEELVFNYNVDRYGAVPQPCYCGEPNCTGFIGGKTQTERATKLSNATIEALGIDDGDGWDTAVAKRPRKKKAGEDDEEYVDSFQPKALGADGVTKVMAALMQCKEKWIAVKLLSRIQRCDDEQVRNRVVKMHGYQILNSQLAAWKEDFSVVLQVLDILHKFPRITRNKIIDSKIESTVQPLTTCGDERVEKAASSLIEIWSTLEVGYRIPRKKRVLNENSTTTTPRKQDRFERRESSRDERKRSKSPSKSRSRSRSPPRGPAVPAGPRNSLPQRNSLYSGPSRPIPPFRRLFNPLPKGWFSAEADGKIYYYSASGATTWTRPTNPAPEPPPPPKPESKDKALQNIIDSIMNAKEQTPQDKTSTPDTNQTPASKESKDKKKEERWRSYDEEKKKKLYENTLFPHIQHVMGKFKSKLPREDLKRFGKEIAKKLVNSDFKAGRVEDPTKVSEKQEKKVKKYCKEFFDKAVVKHQAHEKKRAERIQKAQKAKDGETPPGSPRKLDASPDLKKEPDTDDDGDVKMSDDEEDKFEEDSSPLDPGDNGTNGDNLKRKRELDDREGMTEDGDGSQSPNKKVKSQTPPPPPPPPPAEMSADASADTSPREGIFEREEGAFSHKTMADVLASAQQDTGDDADTTMGEPKTEFNGVSSSFAGKRERSTASGCDTPNPPMKRSPSNSPNEDLKEGSEFEYEQQGHDSRMNMGIETSAG